MQPAKVAFEGFELIGILKDIQQQQKKKLKNYRFLSMNFAGNPDLIRLLIRKGAKVDAMSTSVEGDTALQSAASRGNFDQ